MTLGACKNDSTSTNNNSSNNASSQVSSDSVKLESDSVATENTASNNTAIGTVKDFAISLEEAMAIYQKEVPNTDITGIGIDSSFGNYYYEVNGMDDNTEYELKIDVNSGEVKEKRDEKLDRDEQNGVKRNEDKLDLTNLKALKDITEVAINQAGGGEATDWSLDKELSITYWEIKVKNGNQEHEVKINAQTGEVLESELDD
ncbi:lysis protein [Vagococcus zengguangii]|uniref:Lysis protein n=2 Tax=Vagococcus zengguangii TaxID=2571750 RepID=A0A4D7CY08_9ENTE|nr:lysis protein [Vagococcus zengguangii]TLG81055.1 lysis protein [Vagococcus zengguangii]